MNDMIVKSVDLMGDTVMAAQDGDGTIWVGVRWMCQGMGMSDGQYKRQIKNIQKDLLLKNSGSNLNLNKGSGERDVFCLKLDYLPIWLAKISITPTIQKDHPELADKLLEYQLKAKDILAEAFLPQQPQLPTEPMELLKIHYAALEQVDKKVSDMGSKVEALEERFTKFEQELPMLPDDADEVRDCLNKRVVFLLGGKESNAYRNKSLSKKVFMDAYRVLKNNFNVSRYKAIKKNQKAKAIEVIQRYEPPFFLTVMIDNENSQHTMTWKEMLGDE